MRFQALILALPLLASCPKNGRGIVLDPTKRPLITSNFEQHADYGVPMLDQVRVKHVPEEDWRPLTEAERTPSGALKLTPGYWTGTSQSYCLHAGTYGPSEGKGYEYAPLEGPGKGMIQTILRRSVQNSDIEQQDVQGLIWALQARTKPSKMSERMQLNAARLMTPAQIAEAEGWSINRLPDVVFDKMTENLPEPVVKAMQTERKMRDALQRANNTYEELVEIAVLDGAWPERSNLEDISPNRWSYHPNGFYVRYNPSGYSKTKTWIYVPEPYEVERDELNRITSVAKTDGSWSVKTTYRDDAPLVIEDDPTVRGYRFASIELMQLGDDGEPTTLDIADQGWTFVSVPQQETGQLKRLDSEPSPMRKAEDWDEDDVWKGYDKWKGRYDRGREYYDEYNNWKDRYDTYQNGGSIDDLKDLNRYREGLEAATTGTPKSRAKWLAEHFAGLANAWRWASCQLRGDCGKEGEGSEYDPSEGLAMPGNTAAQRLAQSGRWH